MDSTRMKAANIGAKVHCTSDYYADQVERLNAN